jgi:transcriptional regulator with XRE-family HTH domain
MWVDIENQRGEGRVNFSSREKLIADLIESTGSQGPPPDSAVRKLRGSLTQQQVALKSGVPQGHISNIEAGVRPLTREVALKLAPVLDASADELETAETISVLYREAKTGRLDPMRVLEVILELDENMPDGDAADAATDALVQVLRTSLGSYQQERRIEKEEAEQGAEISTKSLKPEPTRDGLGIRRDKPYGTTGGR